MSIFEYDEEQHMKFIYQEGYDTGIIQGVIETYQDLDVPMNIALQKLIKKMNLSLKDAEYYIKKYWK